MSSTIDVINGCSKVVGRKDVDVAEGGGNDNDVETRDGCKGAESCGVGGDIEAKNNGLDIESVDSGDGAEDNDNGDVGWNDNCGGVRR